MSYLKYKFFLLLAATLFSFSSYAELKPHTAVYSLYAKGFHIAEVTQTLSNKNYYWSMMLNTEPRGLARFIQSSAATEEQLFTFNKDKIELISAISDSGKNELNAKKSAYYDNTKKKFFIKIGDKVSSLTSNKAASSPLLLPLTVGSLQSKKKKTFTTYDHGKLVNKVVTFQGNAEVEYQHAKITAKIIDINSENSSKRLRYYFNENYRVPFRIEKIETNEVNGYLELDALKLN